MVVYVLCMFKGVTVILVTFSRIFYISCKLVVLISCLVYLLGLVDLMIRKHFIGFVVQFLVKSGSSLMKEINDLLLNIVVLTYSRYECQILLHFLFRLKFCLLQFYYWLYTLFNVTHYILDYLSGFEHISISYCDVFWWIEHWFSEWRSYKIVFHALFCVFIILFNTDLGRSVLSTYSFVKPAFCFSMFSVFSACSKFRFCHHKLHNIYMIIVFIGASMEL